MILTCVLMYLFHIEREKKYKNVVHQNDVWHGGKISLRRSIKYFINL